jgi:transcriptional regulator NrdR family protein
MTVVIKRDGNRESFRRDKITKAIESAAKRVDIEKKRVKEIAARVARDVEDNFRDRDEVRSRDIRDRVLKSLEREEKRVAKEFKSFSKD